MGTVRTLHKHGRVGRLSYGALFVAPHWTVHSKRQEECTPSRYLQEQRQNVHCLLVSSVNWLGDENAIYAPTGTSFASF